MRILILGLALLQAACAPYATVAAEAGSTVVVVKGRGSLQCVPGSGVAPEHMQKELLDAGIAVRRFACGHDGRMRAAVCEAGDGRLNLFEIAAGDLERARALGYTTLPAEVAESACVPERPAEGRGPRALRPSVQ